MGLAESLEKLKTFKQADKYEVFREVQEEIFFTPDDQKKIVSEILDLCCEKLVKLLQAERKLLKTNLKKEITNCMDAIAVSAIDNANKDFAYELCWYLSDIVGLKYKLFSEKKSWGYWEITGDEVKIIPRRKTKSSGNTSDNSFSINLK